VGNQAHGQAQSSGGDGRINDRRQLAVTGGALVAMQIQDELGVVRRAQRPTGARRVERCRQRGCRGERRGSGNAGRVRGV
jgi:hypothetical protein